MTSPHHNHRNASEKEKKEQRLWNWMNRIYRKYMYGNATDEEKMAVGELSDIIMTSIKPCAEKKLTAEEQEEWSEKTFQAVIHRLGLVRDGDSHEKHTHWHAVVGNRLSRYVGIAALLVLAFGISFMYLGRSSVPRQFADGGDPAEWSCLHDTTLYLPDGTEVRLKGGSRLALGQDFGERRRMVSLSGQAFFDVATDSARQFVVRTDGIEAVVHGTSFNVMAYPGTNVRQVTVCSGCVEVTNEKKAVTYGRYRHGQQLTYHPADGSATVAQVDADQTTEWMRGEFSLRAATVDELRMKVMQSFGKTLVIEGNAIPSDAKITSTFRHAEPTLDNVMHSVCSVYAAQYRISGSRVIVTPANNIQ